MITPNQSETDIDQLFEFHIEVLKLLLNGEKFSDIESKYGETIKNLDYINIARHSLLSFDPNGELIGAYPISPVESPYKVSVEGVGEGYSMCAIDALGVAYTFNAKTTISTVDYSTKEPIEIIIDPSLEKQEKQDFVVTYKQSFASDDPVPALSVCPTIHFYSDPTNVQDKENTNIINFDEALKSAINQFSVSALKSCLTKSIEKNSGKSISNDCCMSNNC